MSLNETQTLLLIGRLIAVAVALQTIELFQIKKTVNEIWNWTLLKEEFEKFPSVIQKTLNVLLKDSNFFSYLLPARLIAAVWLLAHPHPAAIFVLLVSTLLVSLRWRGTFNGGSDYMTLIILSALFIGTAFSSSPRIAIGCLWYIAIQTCLSYFVSGWAKLSQETWRSGKALPRFFGTSIYKNTSLLRALGERPHLCMVVSWAALAFESAFPLAFLNPTICAIFIGSAILFHLANFYILGLNRFVFAWIATYPALMYCSQWR